MSTNRQIILASASPRRKELLKNIFPTFQIIPSSKEEETIFHTPEAFVMDLSHTKAEDIMQQLILHDSNTSLTDSAPDALASPCLVIGADTIVCYRNQLLGKPADMDAARATLSELSGHTHQVYTGVTLFWNTDAQIMQHSFVSCTNVTFDRISPTELTDYLTARDSSGKYPWADKAGGYGIQEAFGAKFIQKIEGDYFNVVGLPVHELYVALKKFDLI
ncbi:septum formation protein Maf [Kineothrix sp. MSJ-39]|uniref:Maf family protein n=1 Tax=Kineothrix sp. MSJ-39 TaxID=2841533 RepID=UPI001C1116BC|nr:Maf family protein [Kineothrix sp. MSJ-39]MBU5430398.1 septum formation protein Maf [Kineothrix sp. MSJ-39]